ncbi:MAG: SRPBCC family protein [Gemmatimonadales bacterium]
MKWLLIVLAALVGVVALMALIGALVPRDHVAGASVTLRQPAESVWKVVRDLGGIPQWWGEVKQSERIPDGGGPERWSQAMSGFKMALVVEVDDPPHRLVTRIDAPPDAPFGGTWTYVIAPTPGGSRLTVTERGWIGNPIFRFLSRFVFGYYGTQEGYLRALGKRFGEDVRPVREPASS